MTIETSTANVLLALIAAEQAWLIRNLIRLDKRIAVIGAKCPQCQQEAEAREPQDDLRYD
jgi:hypothetical protein